MKDYDLYKAYFYNDSEYYLRKLEKIDNKEYFTFNIYAFFFGIFWFIYRKMYAEAAIIAVVAFLISQLTESNLLISILVGSCFGFLGDHIYIAKATRIVQKGKGIYQEAESDNKERDQLELYLTDKGGVNSTPIWILVIIFGVMFILNLFLALSTGFASF